MGSQRSPHVLGEWQGKLILNLFPPLFFQRIRVKEVGRGFRYCRVRVARSLLTRNLNGTTFGGTIFAAADPFHAVMYWQIFARRGERVQVWLKRAHIDYLKPAASALTLEFEISDEDVAAVVEGIERQGRVVRDHAVDARDASGEVCARIVTEVYLRRPRGEQSEVSAF